MRSDMIGRMSRTLSLNGNGSPFQPTTLIGPGLSRRRRCRDARKRAGRRRCCGSNKARLTAAADRDRDVLVGQQGQRPAARIARVGRDDVGAVDLARPLIALDPDNLVRPVGAVEHRDRAGESAAAQMLFPEIG
jgi:hypothetical protein